MAMGADEINTVVAGFAEAARLATVAGMDGVEVDAGALSLLRQFHSGITNQRDDAYGHDKLLLTTQVLYAVRSAIGPDKVLALRLSCDELAPWAGTTPEHAAVFVDTLADRLDLLTVVRGGPYSATAYRPDAHTPAGFNLDLCQTMHQVAAGRVPVAFQGSVVDPVMAEEALADGSADLVELTRAQIAEPNFVAKVAAKQPVRPCILCNQACRVRDNRNPIISCVSDPRAGHETTDPVTDLPVDAPMAPSTSTSPRALVVGAGAAGLECARVLASRGWQVEVAEQTERTGGALRDAAIGPGRTRLAALVDWLESSCQSLGVTITTGRAIGVEELDAARESGIAVVLATGSRAALPSFPSDATVTVLDARSALAGAPEDLPEGPVVVHDPIGGPIAIGVAEWLAEAGRTVAVVTQDQICGTLLSLTGDLADANVRLQRAGVTRERRALLRGAHGGAAQLEDVWTGEIRSVPAAVVVDCGHRLPDEDLYDARPGTPRAGDCVAPRTALEAVLEGRRRALELCGVSITVTDDSSATPSLAGVMA
jgi:2,4-dienoyl-CoA reductase (NADPH2)